MGSVGSIIGGIAGGIIGFFVGGPLGAVYGAAIGFGIGSIVDPIQPDAPPPGKPEVGKLNITTADEGLPVPDALGTTKNTGNIVWYGGERTVEIPPPEPQGKGSVIGPAVGQATGQSAQGYHYYLTWAVAICSGPVDALYTVYKGDDCIWEGELLRPESGGEETVTIPDIGSMTFFFGTTDQVAPAAMTNKLSDPTLFTNYRRLSYAFFNDGYLGQYNRLPVFKFVFKKSPEISFSSDKEIEQYFYNPAHAIYYILNTMIGLDPQYINNWTFSSAAEKLFLEDRGITVLFNRQGQALTYLETLLAHIDGVLRWGIDGRLHLKLMRSDEPLEQMQIVTEDIMLDDFQFARKSWLDTQNEIKVQYPLLVVGDCELCLLEETAAPVLTLISQNGSVGNYEITEGCPHFFVYFRLSSSSFGPWVFNRTVTSRQFNALASYIGCQDDDIDRELKVVDVYGRDSNFLDVKIQGTKDMIWGGNPTADVNDGTVEIEWYYGSPPFTLQSFIPLVTFDDQFYSQVLHTGFNFATVYFTNQVCGHQKITITDACGQILTGYIFVTGSSIACCSVTTDMTFDDASTPDTINPGSSISLYVKDGVGPYEWETSNNGYSLASQTVGPSNNLTSESGICGIDYDAIAEITVTDLCGDVVNFEIINTGGGWVQMGSPHHSSTTCGSTSLCNPTCFRCYTVGSERWCASPVTRGTRVGDACACVRDGSNWTAWGPGSSPFPPIAPRTMWGILHDGDPLGCGGNCGNCSDPNAGLDLYRAYYDKWTC